MFALVEELPKASLGNAPNAYPPDLLPGQVTTLCFREVGTDGHVGRPIQRTDMFVTFHARCYPAGTSQASVESRESVS